MSKQTVGNKRLFKQRDDGALVATSLKVTLTMVSALTLAVVSAFFADSFYRDMLMARSSTLANAISATQITTANAASDGSAAEEQRLLARNLTEVRRANGDVFSTYIVGYDQRGAYYIANDSGAKLGDKFPGATPRLNNVFSNALSTVEVPVNRNGDEWISTYAPIFDNYTGKTIAVAGMDIPATNYYLLLAMVGFTPLIIGLMVSTLFISADRIRARRRESLRFRSELVSIASHELRTPLTGLRWGEERLMRNKLDSTSADVMKAMYDSTLRLQESIEDILQLANWQAGRYDAIQTVPTDITELIDGIFATQKLPAAQKNLTLETTDDWPQKLIIRIDPQRMKRVFNNLISNAIKYSRPHTHITLNYEKIDDQHLFTITDQGIGIPKDEQAKVFKGFYRASNAIKHEAGGTGMGLYLSRTVVEQHGGKLWLSSKEHKGTTIYVQLP